MVSLFRHQSVAPVLSALLCACVLLLSGCGDVVREFKADLSVESSEQGDIWYDWGDYESALDYYRKAWHFNQEDPYNLEQIMWCHLYLGNYDKAALAGKDLCALVPDDCYTADVTALAFFANGQWDEAITRWERGYAIAVKDGETETEQLCIEGLVWSHIGKQKMHDAAQWSKRALQLEEREPNNAVYDRLAAWIIAMETGRESEAADWLAEAAALDLEGDWPEPLVRGLHEDYEDRALIRLGERYMTDAADAPAETYFHLGYRHYLDGNDQLAREYLIKTQARGSSELYVRAIAAHMVEQLQKQ